MTNAHVLLRFPPSFYLTPPSHTQVNFDVIQCNVNPELYTKQKVRISQCTGENSKTRDEQLLIIVTPSQ